MDNINNNTGFSFDLPKGNSSIIKVIGVGGGGNNALRHMYERGIHGVDFVICNTDSQTLDNNPVANKVQLGLSITEGLGAGADPEVGEKAAIESIDEIKAALGQNTKMVFITAGMGGGTGTGAAPVIAKVAKEMGILTIGIVTVPFSFEGKRRLDQADIGLDKLRNNVDSLIVINNDKLRQQYGNLGFKSGFSKADEVLTNAAKGMAEVITGYFDVNIDFRDAKSVLQNSGTALMSTGVATGENKAEEAVRKALDSPLLNDNKITGAKNVLLLIRSGSEEATMDEIGIINDYIQKEAGDTADIIFGVGSDEELGDGISVLVIATGFSKEYSKHSGVTETIKYSLDGRSSNKNQSIETSENDFSRGFPLDKKIVSLDDEDDFRPQTPENRFQQKKVAEPAQVSSYNEIVEKPVEMWEKEDESMENQYNLFSFEDEVSEEDLEAESLIFEVEKPIKTEVKSDAVEYNFMVNEPIAEEYFIQEPKVEKFVSEEKPVENKVEIFEIETFVKEKTEPKVEAKIVVEKEEIKEEPKSTSFGESQFTFVEVPSDKLKVNERRNKLNEFNSRYQTVDSDLQFETVPAFRRKNIVLDHENHSDQNIQTYLRDDNGRMEVRENRFLNKDVD
ncbi:cell division protein FtsZ [Halpernia frigidisoli]|uniref:Cell division protein FtsZ n=1 Tax=Halpernia frigidisoli TaxID=1125876 RepID=A0A1I3GTF7_9FLAO|nr:cell division protein FtsZ [Halpernia frigidisoli]SFI26673.1 cell division protein FtsZ [Halpernia frigidisoli]